MTLDKDKILKKLKEIGNSILAGKISPDALNKLSDDTIDEPEEIPTRFIVKRRKYTLSPEALAQRRANSQKANEKMVKEGLATGPTTPEGKKASSRNSWKHGLYAQSFMHSFRKPCKSTCDKYPCSLVNDGATEPGEDCLDKQIIYETVTAIMDAMLDNDFDKFNGIAAFATANNIQILRDMQETILEDGVTMFSDLFDKEGHKIGRKLVQHPALALIPKFMEQLGVTPRELMLTPKALIDTDKEKEKEKSVTDFMTDVRNRLRNKKPSPKSDDEVTD